MEATASDKSWAWRPLQVTKAGRGGHCKWQKLGVEATASDKSWVWGGLGTRLMHHHIWTQLHVSCLHLLLLMRELEHLENRILPGFLLLISSFDIPTVSQSISHYISVSCNQVPTHTRLTSLCPFLFRHSSTPNPTSAL